MEIEIHTPRNPELPDLRYQRIFLVGERLVFIGFWTFSDIGIDVTKNRERFFNSFTVNESEVNSFSDSDTADGPDNNGAYNFGLFLGQLLFFVVLGGLLLAAVLLAWFMIKRQRKNRSEAAIIPGPKPPKEAKIACPNCETTNNCDSKYCKGCGYPLPKEE
ncbi:hypothetical protein [Maribacter sp. 2-571]|uniref:hypothetical protein n=1 Tax=Maribacter sp. 2-571 TaxID=3417569 RepID=UPI003D357C1B